MARAPSETIATYEEMLRSLMSPAQLEALQTDEIWGGSNEAWSVAVLGAMGYKDAAAADEARGGRTKHTWASLRAALEGSGLEEI